MKTRHRLLAVQLIALLTSLAEAQTPPAKDKESSRPPQVRTYSTVTMVDDPAKVPRLPTQKGGPSTPTPRPTEAKEPVRPATPATPQPAVSERRNLDAVRQDLRATAKEMRNASKHQPGRDTAAPAVPVPKHPAQDLKHPPRPQLDKLPRTLLRERNGRDN